MRRKPPFEGSPFEEYARDSSWLTIRHFSATDMTDVTRAYTYPSYPSLATCLSELINGLCASGCRHILHKRIVIPGVDVKVIIGYYPGCGCDCITKREKKNFFFTYNFRFNLDLIDAD